jgi:hypothetical protein
MSGVSRRAFLTLGMIALRIKSQDHESAGVERTANSFYLRQIRKNLLAKNLRPILLSTRPRMVHL